MINVSGLLKRKRITRVVAFTLPIVLGVLYWLYPKEPDTLKEGNLPGVWLSDYRYGQSGIMARVKGETEFFRSGKYNFHGSISYSGHINGNTISTTYRSDGTGTWLRYNDKLEMSLSSLKSTPEYIEYNGKEMNVADVSYFVSFPVPENTQADGKVQLYRVVLDEKDQQILEAENPYGKAIEIMMKRK